MRICTINFYPNIGLLEGELTAYTHPDPKDAGIYILYGPVVYLLFLLWIFTFIPYLITFLILLANREIKIF